MTYWRNVYDCDPTHLGEAWSDREEAVYRSFLLSHSGVRTLYRIKVTLK